MQVKGFATENRLTVWQTVGRERGRETVEAKRRKPEGEEVLKVYMWNDIGVVAEKRHFV